MPLKEYSYQNLSLQSMKGERWKTVPGLEGYYVISNLGRVKRLEYEIQYDDGRKPSTNYTFERLTIFCIDAEAVAALC